MRREQTYEPAALASAAHAKIRLLMGRDPMAKGYWIAHVEVYDEQEYKKYIDANAIAFKKYGGVCLARAGRYQVMEGHGRMRNVIWEFERFQDAVDCYNSTEYQTAKAFRANIAAGDFVIVEGLPGGPMPAAAL